MKISKDLKSAKSIKNRIVDVGYVKEDLYSKKFPIFAKTKSFTSRRNSSYGLINSENSAIEPMYEHAITEIAPNVSVMEFVADQFFSMKRRYEELSNKGGSYGVLNPLRGLERIDHKYSSYLTTIFDLFDEYIFSENNTRIVSFVDYCKYFLFFIRKTRMAATTGGVPITKCSFINSSKVDFHGSGLVIDFKDDKFNDIALTYKEWMSDSNFSLYCDAAKKAGFFVDRNYPFRIVADISSKKMQRSAEFYGAGYFPGSPGTIFDDFYLQVGLYDFIILKDKLLSSYEAFRENNPIIYNKSPCRKNKSVKIRTQKREVLELIHLDLPPIPGKKIQTLQEYFGTEYVVQNENESVSYGLHSEKYDLLFFTRLYVEVRMLEINKSEDYLTQKRKAAIIQEAVKKIMKGNIRAAYSHICRQLDAFRLITH